MLFRPKSSIASLEGIDEGVMVQHDPHARETMSEGCARYIYYSALRGILYSAITCFKNKGMTEEDIQGKVIEIANMFVANGDVDNRESEMLKEYIKDSAFYEDKSDGMRLKNEGYPDSYWGIKRKLFGCVTDEIKWGSDNSKFNDRELELIKTFHEAQEAYWKAQDALRSYCEDVTTETIKEIITKYADTLRKVDESWFADISRSCNFDYDALIKRRNEKKAEDDNFIARPVEV